MLNKVCLRFRATLKICIHDSKCKEMGVKCSESSGVNTFFHGDSILQAISRSDACHVSNCLTLISSIICVTSFAILSLLFRIIFPHLSSLTSVTFTFFWSFSWARGLAVPACGKLFSISLKISSASISLICKRSSEESFLFQYRFHRSFCSFFFWVELFQTGQAYSLGNPEICIVSLHLGGTQCILFTYNLNWRTKSAWGLEP